LGHHHTGWTRAPLHAAYGDARCRNRDRHHRARPQCLGGRSTRCSRSPLQSETRTRLMLFAVGRRLIEMAFVMFGISVLVFLIFFATPGADPASRIAGRNASPETLEAVRRSFGLD